MNSLLTPPAVMDRLRPTVPRVVSLPLAPTPAPRWHLFPELGRKERHIASSPYRRPQSEAQRAVPPPRWQPRTPARHTSTPPRVTSMLVNPVTGAAANPEIHSEIHLRWRTQVGRKEAHTGLLPSNLLSHPASGLPLLLLSSPCIQRPFLGPPLFTKCEAG